MSEVAIRIEPPAFTTKRLYLRGVTTNDALAIQRHINDYEVIRYFTAAFPWPYPAKGAETFVLNYVLPNQGYNRWFRGLFLKEMPDDLIGFIELWKHGQPDNRAFWLGRKYWGQGLMQEALFRSQTGLLIILTLKC